MKTHTFSIFAAIIATLCSFQVYGAFFQLAEQSASGLGNNFAGGAAIAEDASTAWFNPAGLTRLEDRQLLVAGHIVSGQMEFDDDGSTTVLGTPLTGGDGGNVFSTELVPNFYLTRPIDDRLAIGFAVNIPFGLGTEYQDGWQGRYHALTSELTAVNLNTSVGYRVNDLLSVGAGVSLQWVDARLSNAIDLGTLCVLANGPAPCAGLGVAPQANDGRSTLTADSTGFGFNVGMLWNISPSTRLGVAYRSPIDHEFEGESRIATFDPGGAAVASAAGIVSSDASADATFPATISVSLYHEINNHWAVMGDVTQTRWGRIQELRVRLDPPSGVAESVTTFGLDDAYRYSLGATYSTGGPWTYRFGVGYDETPVPNAQLRGARMPDSDRSIVTFGLGYDPGGKWAFDFGIAHTRFDDTDIDQRSSLPENVTRGNLTGRYDDSYSNIFAFQAVYRY